MKWLVGTLIFVLSFSQIALADAPAIRTYINASSSEHEREIREVLTLIKDLRLSDAPMPKRYDLGLVGDDFWSFFTLRIHTVTEVSVETAACKNGAMAFVSQLEHPNVAFVCPLFFEKVYSRYEKASVLLHEAHHTDGHSHVMCLAGGKVGSAGGCDESIKDDGAYAVTVETLAKMILRGIGIPEEDRAQLRLGLLEALDSFNAPVDRPGNSGIYLQSHDGKKAYFFDGTELFPAPLFGRSKILSRGLSLLSVPQSGAKITGIDVFKKSLPAVEARGQCALHYNSKKGVSRLVDVMNDNFFSICVYEKGLIGKISAQQKEDAEINWPFVATQVISSEELGNDEQNAVFVKSSRGEFYRVRFVGGKKLEVKAVPNPTKGYQQIFFFNSDRTGLRNDGVLMKVDFETEEWIPYPGLESLRFHYSTRPFMWSHDLMEAR